MSFRKRIEEIIVAAMNQAVEISKIDDNAGEVIYAPKAVNLILQAAKKELVPDGCGFKSCRNDVIERIERE